VSAVFEKRKWRKIRKTKEAETKTNIVELWHHSAVLERLRYRYRELRVGMEDSERKSIVSNGWRRSLKESFDVRLPERGINMRNPRKAM
jgi:hypothetical protein